MGRSVGLVLMVGAWTLGISSMACALPVLDTKDTSVQIDVSGKVMNIGSMAPNNVINWVDFSIARGETVAFDKKNYLNYVTGHAASEIYGTLTGKGNIYIINPNGILIGDGATVNVGNLYLSTRTLNDAQVADFRAGRSPLKTAANANGDVVNLGHLEAKAVVVEGNVIKFKNVADVKATQNIDVHAKGEIHIGYEVGDVIKAVNETEYKDVQAPSPPTQWNFADKVPVWYMLVRNEYELQNMKNNLQGNYMLARDLTVTESFQPIGGSSGRYDGYFDGLGHEIKLEQVNVNGNYIGLFSIIDQEGVVKNVGVITSMDISAMNSSPIYVGGIAGKNWGKLHNVWHSGSVRVTSSSGCQYLGGIVGYNYGGTVENGCNMGAITALGESGAYVGGIVGYNESYDKYNLVTKEHDYYEAAVKNAYTMGNLDSVGCAGGIVGFNKDGRLENVYNTGTVTGKRVGGIIGRNQGKAAKREETVFCAYHAAGSLNGTFARGGIAGEDTNGVYSHVFYEDATVSNETFVVSETASGRETLEKVQTFLDDGWSISSEGGAKTTWRIYEGESMPLLTAFLQPKDNISIAEYDGTIPAGTYGLKDKSSVMISAQLDVYEDKDGKHYRKGYDYVSDVTCIVPKQETNGSKPADTTKPADPNKPADPQQPINPANPTGPQKPVDPAKPVDTEKPAVPEKPDNTLKSAGKGENSGKETTGSDVSIGKEYENMIVALQHLETEEQQAVSAAMENETEKLVVVGSGVRLPDSMSAEDFEAMLSETEVRENA